MDIDLTKAQPDMEAKIVGFFKGRPDVEGDLESLDVELKADLPNPLDFKELSPELAGELAQAQNMRKFWEGREESLKRQVKDLAGKERGLIQAGDEYAFDIKESKGRTTVKAEDYERFIRDAMTDAAVKDCREKYAKTGEPTVSVSVKKLK